MKGSIGGHAKFEAMKKAMGGKKKMMPMKKGEKKGQMKDRDAGPLRAFMGRGDSY